MIYKYDVIKEPIFGVIITSGYKEESYIEYYNSNYNHINTQIINEAQLSDSWNTIVSNSSDVFIVPKGIFDKEDAHKILAINKDSLNMKEYFISLSYVTDFALVNSKLFSASNLNGNSTIESIDYISKERKNIEIKNDIIYSMIGSSKYLYVFLDKTMNVYDEYLSLVNVVDTSYYFKQASRKYCFNEDGDLYLVVNKDISEENHSMGIVKISEANDNIEEIKTPEGLCFNDIYFYNDNIIVMGTDIVNPIVDKELNENCTIYIIDNNNEKVKENNIGVPVYNTCLVGDKLIITYEKKFLSYTDSSSSKANGEICIYDLKRNKIIKSNEINIPRDPYSYLGKIILLKNEI